LGNSHKSANPQAITKHQANITALIPEKALEMTHLDNAFVAAQN